MQLIADLADRLLLDLNRFVCAFLLTVMAMLVFGDVVGRLEYAEFARMQRNPVLRVSMGVVYLAVPVVPGFRCCIFCSCCRNLCCAFPA